MLTQDQLAYCREVQLDPDTVRDLEDGTWVCAKPLLFHWTVIRGYWDDPIGYFNRWCFQDEAGAKAALLSFPPACALDWDPEGWHRHPPSGRRRENGIEFVSP